MDPTIAEQRIALLEQQVGLLIQACKNAHASITALATLVAPTTESDRKRFAKALDALTVQAARQIDAEAARAEKAAAEHRAHAQSPATLRLVK